MQLSQVEQKSEIEAAGKRAIYSYNQTDFVKRRVAVEVQFGKYSFIAYDLFVKHLAFYVGNEIDVGVEILPMKEMQEHMSSGPGYYEGALYDVVRQGCFWASRRDVNIWRCMHTEITNLTGIAVNRLTLYLIGQSMPNPIPDRCHTITPCLIVKDAVKAINFYAKAFGAMEIYRMVGPDGQSVMHAELMIGDSVLFLAGEFPGMDVAWVKEGQWPTVSLHLYVQDCDRVFQQAVAAGCEVVMPLTDMFWGDRHGNLRDPFDHRWTVATRVEDVPPEEMKKRAAAFFSGHGG